MGIKIIIKRMTWKNLKVPWIDYSRAFETASNSSIINCMGIQNNR